jgi:hypothetical protein
MKCKAVLREIEEMEAGASPSAEANSHLLVCQACRGFADERARLRLLVRSLDKVSAPPEFDWNLRARLREERNESAPARRWLAGFAPGAQAITAAAFVTLVLVAIVVYRQTRPATSTTAQPAQVAKTNIKESAVLGSRNEVVPEVNSVKMNSEDVSPASVSSGTRGGSREQTVARGVKTARANTARTDGARPLAPQPRIFSNDSASRVANDVTVAGGQDALTNAGPVIFVPVPTQNASQLRFEDGQGMKRTLSPVNFGGQELIERPDKARLVPASEKGIW